MVYDLTAIDTRSKKPTPATMAKDKNSARRNTLLLRRQSWLPGIFRVKQLRAPDFTTPAMGTNRQLGIFRNSE